MIMGNVLPYLMKERYPKYLWNHRPITDFWRVGKGYAKKLEKEGLYTMGDIAKCSKVQRMNIIMKNFFMIYLVLMLSYLLTMHGVMNHVQ